MSRGRIVCIVLWAIILLTLTAAGFVGLAHAQEACAPHNLVLAEAMKKWKEAPVLTGPAAGGQLAMELLVSPERTWTVLLLRPDDIACVVASGTDLLVSGNVPPTGDGM